MIRVHPDARVGAALFTSAWALCLSCGLPADEREPGAVEPPEPQGSNAVALTRAASCEDVLDRIRTDTLARLVERADELRQRPEVYTGDPVVVLGGEEVLPPPPVAPGSPVAQPATDVGDASEGAAGPGFSDTTLQVRDVDEADVIKADGDHLYVLQGSSLVKLRAWPAAETRTLAAVAIEGQPYDMFVSDGKAVVFSSVNRELAAASSPAPAGGGSPYYPYYSFPTFTKVTVLDVDAESPAVLRETFLEGYYVSSRRHGEVVRAVIQDNYKVPPLDGVYIEYFTPFGEPYRQQDIDAQVDAWLERITWAVLETEIGDYVPRQLTVVDGELVEHPPTCADYYQPALDLSRSGVTQVFSIDLGDDDGSSALPAATVLARAERVYANGDVVLMAQTDYGSFETGYRPSTHLHRFDLDGRDTVYVASGSVPGYVQSQFSLDERAGVIRVSTTESGLDPLTGIGAEPVNRVLTLTASGGSLDVLGQTEVFGQNEQIYATRFIGDLGYVVTFRQTDPLFVVDLSEPAVPSVVGELHVPGFSNFLFPLGADHLLAIGRDATDEGRTLGLALSIFDVSDPGAPALAHKYVYEGDGYSEASFDHRGITFHPDGGRIAFPFYDYQTGASSVEVFDVDAAQGLTRRGALAPAQVEHTLEECVVLLGYGETALDDWLQAEIDAWPEYEQILLAQCRSQEQMRRGLLRDDHVFGVSTHAVYAQDVASLSEPAPIRAALPPATYYGPDYAPGGAIAGTAGAAGAAGAAGSGGAAMVDPSEGSPEEAGAGGAAGAPADL